MHIMPVLIGVGDGPTLSQHKYNRAYFQTPDRYTCQKHIGDVSGDFKSIQYLL